jgi:lysophospholipase L1-like esterase
MKQSAKKTMRILLLGDSLIEFFDWQARFQGVTVLNRGIAGETVQGLLARLPGELAAAGFVDVIAVMTGANNLIGEDYGFLPEYEEILVTVRSALPEARLVVTSLLPFQLPWLAAGTVDRLNESLRNMAARNQADFLNVCDPFVAAQQAGTPCFFEDGVHLTDKGYGIWAGLLAVHIVRE